MRLVRNRGIEELNNRQIKLQITQRADCFRLSAASNVRSERSK